VGAGKTTIVRRFLKNALRDITVGIISNPSKSLGWLLSWVAMAFEFPDAGQDVARTYDNLVRFLLEQYAKGKRSVLIIDEAQNLDVNMLEELRMLSNVNNGKDQLLQVVLVGQPELLETLNRPDLRQFAQRVSVHCHLDPLAPSETAAYIRHRLDMVGASGPLFDDKSSATVHFFTGGVPRLINLLCDQALLYSFSEDQPQVSAEMVAEVVIDRARSGLTAFKTLPEGWNGYALQKAIWGILQEIRSEESA
jgi:type II secretory pathway predicted ATPase ExeA